MKILTYQRDILRASISWDPSFCDEQDSYTKVWIDGHIQEEKAIWGIDPVQAFALAIRLIEQLTEEHRLEGERQHTDWRLEVE